jgi:hypothetical protein
MNGMDTDTALRLAAFAQIKRLNELRDGLSASDLATGCRKAATERGPLPQSPADRGYYRACIPARSNPHGGGARMRRTLVSSSLRHP